MREASIVSRTLGVAGLFALGLFVGACGPGVGGRAGDAVLATGAKPQCGALGVACVGQKLDAPIALGASFELDVRYQIAGTSGPPTTIESADASVLVVDGDHLRAVGAGASAILFVGPDRRVLDFLHLWVQPASELRIVRYDRSGTPIGRVQSSVHLLVHDELLVTIEPFAKGQPLAGAFDLGRKIDGESVAIVPDSVAGFYRVVARKPGATRVTFEALNLTTTWSIEVEP
jgi:hypothetical protein